MLITRICISAICKRKKLYCYTSCNTTGKRNMNTLVFRGACLKKLNLVSLNIFIYLHTPTLLSDPFCMKQLKLTLRRLKLFYYSRKRWPCRLQDALITANVHSTTATCASLLLNNPLGKTTSPLVWSSETCTHAELHFVQRKSNSA